LSPTRAASLPKTMPLPSLSSCLGHKFPLSSDFPHTSDRLDQPHATPKRHQSHHPISSRILRSLHLSLGSGLIPVSFSPHLVVPLPAPSSPHLLSICLTATAYHHRTVLTPSYPSHQLQHSTEYRISRPSTLLNRTGFKPTSPTATAHSDIAHVICSAPFPHHRPRASFPLYLTALESMTPFSPRP
jgi:hypothetical protein